MGRHFEEKQSGKTLDRLDRPELARLLSEAKQGKIRKLYLFRLDRLARSGIRDMLGVVNDLRRFGVEIINVADEGFDMSSPAAPVIIAVLAWVAQMERDALVTRAAAARARVEAKGGKWGHPWSMPPALRRKARELKQQGRTIRAIAIALKVPKSTIARAIKEIDA